MSLELNFLMKAWVQYEAGLYLEASYLISEWQAVHFLSCTVDCWIRVRTLGHCLAVLTDDLTPTDVSEVVLDLPRFGLHVGKHSERKSV